MQSSSTRKFAPYRQYFRAAMMLGTLGSCGLPLAYAQYQVPAEPLQTLRASHPRLMATNEDFAMVKTAVEKPGPAADVFAVLRKNADGIMVAPLRQYEMPDGKQMLATSRWVKDRALKLGLAYRVTGERKYADRLWRELENAGNFKDWNPPHFLDTAEMTFAFGIGYDWLYDAWTPEQREFLRRAIVEKGLKAGMKDYQNAGWWVNTENNWNQVCNGGMLVGALAIADVEPTLASDIIRNAMKSLPKAMHEFAPDGGSGEGPGYWDYTTQYTTYLLASLRSALGTDFGISREPGLAATGTFPIAMTGPTDKLFNYADCSEARNTSPQLYWMATMYNAPEMAAYQLPYSAKIPSAFDLIWGARWMVNPPKLSYPLSAYYRKSEAVSFRSDSENPNATYIGFKGGNNAFNHSHLDLGSFVVDALGERWVKELAGEDYSLPGYFGKERWNYYRLRAEGQNTLVINPGSGPDQGPKAFAPISRFSNKAGANFAITDLSAAYDPANVSVQRGVRLLGAQVLVQDEVNAKTPANLWWFMHTGAQVEADGASATLRQKDKALTARILSPAGARFEIMDAAPLPSSPNPPGQNKNEGIRKLAIHLPDTSETRITVLLTPGSESATPPKVEALRDWK